MNVFGDAVMVRTTTGERLAIFLWRSDGCQPSIFLVGRVVQLPLDAILNPWTCPTCGGSRIFWGLRIPPRCPVCQPPTATEKEFVLRYATGAVRHLADKLDAPNAKALMYAQLDEAVSTGDVRALVRLSLEMLAGSCILKHELGDLP